MSLAALNSPPLIAATGVGVLALLPALESAFANGSYSWMALKSANFLAFAVNLVAVSRPGRIDGAAAQAESSKEGSSKEVQGQEEMEKLSPGRNGKTLVAPAGWAFAIWGPIFLGEFVFVGSQLFLPETAAIAPLVRKITGPFVVAQVFQSLWTASFRPKYKGNLMYISTAMLSATAYSLSRVHAAIVATPKAYSHWQYALLFLPMSLHFGWTTAASLVNLNGAFSMSDEASSKSVALLGHVSVVVAGAVGAFVSINRSAPVYGGVIAWALLAVADGMKKRVKDTQHEDPGRIGVRGARTQERLSKIGAFVSGAASVVAALTMITGKGRVGIAP